MSNLRLKRIMACAILPLLMSGCAPLIPDNYLAPSHVLSSQRVDGKWIQPRLIPISAKMLNTPEGRDLLEAVMQPQPYRIGAYDNLNIIVWGHPELSTVSTANTPLPGTAGQSLSGFNNMTAITTTNNPAILVQTDGTIFYPYVGHLKVVGLTMDEVQDKITQRLSSYLRNPQVSVQVAKFRNRNAYVLGEVKNPGMLPLTDKPLTLLEAISTAGGINPMTADPTHIYVVRGSYLAPDVYWINAQTPQALIMASEFPLQENDIVYVSAATLNSWNNFINQILPSFSTYYITKGLAQ
jgi:polysaccharide export outer membrane protein